MSMQFPFVIVRSKFICIKFGGVSSIIEEVGKAITESVNYSKTAFVWLKSIRFYKIWLGR